MPDSATRDHDHIVVDSAASTNRIEAVITTKAIASSHTIVEVKIDLSCDSTSEVQWNR